MCLRSAFQSAAFARIAAVAAALIACAPRPAAAEDWPARPVTLLLSFAGGGIMDLATRAIAKDLTEALGQTVVVETKTGAGGMIGVMAIKNATPDGYTFLVSAVGPMVFRPIMEKDLGFDAAKDFTPVIMIGDTTNAILASPKLGVGSVKELSAYAAKHQNRLNIGHPGVGTMGQFCGALLAQKLGIDGNMVAYRGAAPIVTDLLGGQIDIGAPAYGPGSSAVSVLAVSSSERVDTLPDVPTLKESGIDMECSTWMAIYGPAGVPRPIVVKLNAAIDAFLRKPETRKMFSDVGLRALGGSPERLRDRAVTDTKEWGPLIRSMAPAK